LHLEKKYADDSNPEFTDLDSKRKRIPTEKAINQIAIKRRKKTSHASIKSWTPPPSPTSSTSSDDLTDDDSSPIDPPEDPLYSLGQLN